MQTHRLAAQLELAAGDLRGIEQVVRQSCHVADLSLDDGLTPDALRIVGVLQLLHRDGVTDQRQRIAQFMRECRAEVILAHVRILQRLGILALAGDVLEHRIHLVRRRLTRSQQRHRVHSQPARLAELRAVHTHHHTVAGLTRPCATEEGCSSP